MPEVIALACAACGAQLDVSELEETVTCPHCGTTNLVRRQNGHFALEAHARCPRCRRNDRVEKITAILASQVRQITSLPSEIEDEDEDGEAPPRSAKGYTQTSVLAQRLAPPERPTFPPVESSSTPNLALAGALLAALGAAGFAGLGVFGGLTATTDEDGLLILGATGCVAMVALGLAALLGYAWWGLRRRGQERVARIYAGQRAETERWEAAMRRWNALYYCRRDDCVFVPGEKTSAPLEGMASFLYDGGRAGK